MIRRRLVRWLMPEIRRELLKAQRGPSLIPSNPTTTSGTSATYHFKPSP